MLKYLMPLVLLLGFTACELNEEDILKSIVGSAKEVPEGTYVSQCVQSEDSLTGSIFTIELGAESYTIKEDTYLDNLCASADETGIFGLDIAVSLPGPDLGEGFSVFENADGKKVPYFYDGSEFVLGEPQDSLPSGEDDFSGFQDDLENGRVAVYQLQPAD